MCNKPIIIVAGEPNSVFLEIFFKSIRGSYRKPLILIASKKLLLSQMKQLKFNYKVELVDKKKLEFKKLSLKKINLIDVDYQFTKPFEIISDKSNEYISKCFIIALEILKNNECSGLINGPVSKKNFLKTKFLGITEYLSHKTSIKKDAVMLIYNKQLSVSPLTTHLPIKDINKMISIKKILNHVDQISKFYKKKFKKIS